MIALVPTVEMFTTLRPSSMARMRAMASCCTLSSVRPKSALLVWAKMSWAPSLHRLGHELVVDDVEADVEAGACTSVRCRRRRRSCPECTRAAMRSMRSGANGRQNERSGMYSPNGTGCFLS